MISELIREEVALLRLRQRNVIYVCSREGWMAAYRGYEKRGYNYYRRQVAAAIAATVAAAAAAAAYGECEESTYGLLQFPLPRRSQFRAGGSPSVRPGKSHDSAYY